MDEQLFTVTASGPKAARLDVFLLEALKEHLRAGTAPFCGAPNEADADMSAGETLPEQAAGGSGDCAAEDPLEEAFDETDAEDDASGLDSGADGTEDGTRGDATGMAAARARVPLTRAAVQKAVEEGRCAVNGSVRLQSSFRVRKGDTVTLRLPAPEGELVPEEGDVDVVYEDGALIVVNKAAGLTVHPCPSWPKETLIQRLASRYPELVAMGGLRPGIVHRLDRETSGLMAVARTESARLYLERAFAQRRTGKCYLALVRGVPPASGTCAEPLGRDPKRKTRRAVLPVREGGREALTDFETLGSTPDGSASLVRLHIHTGRTHQIRVHMATLGHPLLGDGTYGQKAARALAPRVMLHACALDLPHPGDGEHVQGERVRFLLRPPGDFTDTLYARSKRTLPVVITGCPGGGKSLVTSLLAKLGHRPYADADAIVTTLYGPDGEATRWLCDRFGPDMRAADGCCDRARLMELFTGRPDLRLEVEKLVHSLVLGNLKDFLEKANNDGLDWVPMEIPLYFECGWDRDVFTPKPLTLCVVAGREERGRRLAATRGWSEEKIAAIDGWQWDEERKARACDLVLVNEAGRDELEQRVADTVLPRIERRVREADEAVRSGWEDLIDRAVRTALDGYEAGPVVLTEPGVGGDRTGTRQGEEV